MSSSSALYVVATPIGNLDDMSPRAIATLKSVDLIAAEDTRHAQTLCRHFGIETNLSAYHDFSDHSTVQLLLQRLKSGESIALVSDAGTPLIADPGFRLVSLCRQHSVQVIPIPGASALTAALSVAGLPSDRFVFEGFLPAKAAARNQTIEQLQGELRSIVFYESPHRIVDSVQALATGFGGSRRVFIGREISKLFEQHFLGELQQACRWLQEDANHRRGEFVIVVEGASKEAQAMLAQSKALHIAKRLRTALATKEAAALAAELTGARKNEVYAGLLSDQE